MCTHLNPVAINWSRIPGLVLFLSLTCGAGFAYGQTVHVEWLEFEEDGRRFLVLNAYEADNSFQGDRSSNRLADSGGASESGGEIEGTGASGRLGISEGNRTAERGDAYESRIRGVSDRYRGTEAKPPSDNRGQSDRDDVFNEDGESDLDGETRNIYPLIVEFPLKSVPDTPEAWAFLSALEEVDNSSGAAGSWKPDNLDEWEKLLHALTTRHELWLHGKDILCAEISDVLKDVYEVHGYPSLQDPVFPHLERGLLTALDSEGRPMSTIDVDLDEQDSDALAYKVVTFANVGSEPVQVYTDERLLSSIHLSGAQFTLEPDERIRRLLRLESSVFAFAQQESRATVRYATAGLHLDALQVKAHHHGWIQSASATLASVAAFRFGTWDDIALSHIALAAGLLFALIFFAISKSFAPTLLTRVTALPSRRLSREVVTEALSRHDLRRILQDFIRSAAHWKSEMFVPGLARLTRESSHRIASMREASTRQIVSLKHASIRGTASFKQVSTQGIVSLRQASSRGIASLQRASSSGMSTLIRTSSRQISSLHHEIVLPARHRTARVLKRLYIRARAAVHDMVVLLRQLAVNVYLYKEFATKPIEPRDGTECVERIRCLTQELESSGPAASFTAAATRSLYREAKRLARRLDSDLAHEFVEPTTTNFQILWALRFLANILAQPADDVSAVIHQWLHGADHVLRYEGREGIGPTIPEFLSLLAT